MLKVGDIVVIANDLEEADAGRYKVCTVEGMLDFRGRTAQITQVGTILGSECYRIDIDKSRYHWTEDMFDEIYSSTRKIYTVTGDQINDYKNQSTAFLDMLTE